MDNSNPVLDAVEFVLRAVTHEDREFLLSVYESSRETELSMVQWDDPTRLAFVVHQFDAQTTYYASEYPDARHEVIALAENGEPIGRIYVNRSPDRISILDVTILPTYRRRGIGSVLIAGLIEEARSTERPLQIYVECFNPSRSFFLSRGFVIENDDGFNLRLVWNGFENL
jgi:GNAT superfamily N-acetyltransferase